MGVAQEREMLFELLIRKEQFGKSEVPESLK